MLLAQWLNKEAQELSPHCDQILKYCRYVVEEITVMVLNYFGNKNIVKVLENCTVAGT